MTVTFRDDHPPGLPLVCRPGISLDIDCCHPERVWPSIRSSSGEGSAVARCELCCGLLGRHASGEFRDSLYQFVIPTGAERSGGTCFCLSSRPERSEAEGPAFCHAGTRFQKPHASPSPGARVSRVGTWEARASAPPHGTQTIRFCTRRTTSQLADGLHQVPRSGTTVEAPAFRPVKKGRSTKRPSGPAPLEQIWLQSLREKNGRAAFVSAHDFTACRKTPSLNGFVSGHDFSRANSAQ